MAADGNSEAALWVRRPMPRKLSAIVRGCAGDVEHQFSPVQPGIAEPAQPVGPSSNTGQKSQSKGSLTAPIIDFCVAVMDSEKAKKLFRKMPLTEVLRYVFGTGPAIAVGPLRDVRFNHYQRSAVMVDGLGEVCGKIGLRDDGAIQISMTGQGCGHVPSWHQVADRLDDLQARVSHVDIAIDDLTGETFDLQTFIDHYEAGDFTMNGRPPTPLFVDDMGSGKGCSFYVGQRGHKQLNAYEKGKQLGDPESPHVRCELRLYAKRIDLPNDVLRNPGRYFGAAYPMLEAFVIGEVERMGLREQIVDTSVGAAERFLRTQTGTTLGVFAACFDSPDEFMDWLRSTVLRTDRPGRWKAIQGDLHAHVRASLERSLQEATQPADDSHLYTPQPRPDFPASIAPERA